MNYGNRKLFDQLSLNFTAGDKIGILGNNGAGKTTLLKIITGKLTPTSGDIELSENVIFNYIDQERIALNDKNTVLDEIGEGKDFVQLGKAKITIWAYLKRFLFPDERIKTKVGWLSGGEKSRLMLAKILKQGGNFIVLDEPTNDLDLSTLRILEEALLNFGGCVVVVSHDRFFLNHVCNGILAFEANGNLKYEVGNYNYYKSKKKTLQAPSGASANKEKKELREKPKNPKPRKLTWKEKIELEGMEEKIMEEESRKEAIEQLFSDPDFYKNNGQEVKELQLELENLESALNNLYTRWDELEKIKNAEYK